jgi:molecular chaperone GrpE
MHPPTDRPDADAPFTDPEPAEAWEARISALQAERDEFHDKWMRAEAEMQNVRTRAKREVDETRQYAVQKFARDIAEVADNMRRGLNSLPRAEAGEPELVARLREGFEGVERSFLAVLERNGIARTDPTGATFDANLHQAMGEQPTADHPPGTILQAWTPAWTLNGRLLRPAMVVVAKASETRPVDSEAAAKLNTTA